MAGQLNLKVAVVSFTDPRDTAHAEERERYIAQRHGDLVEFVRSAGFEPVDPMPELRGQWTPEKGYFGVRSTAEVRQVAAALKAADVQALLIGCWHWTEPHLPLSLVRELDVPVCLVADEDPRWASAVLISAVGATLWEVEPNLHAATHFRVRGDWSELLPWLRGVIAAQNMRRQSVLLWGWAYCLRMDHLMDDISTLKSFMIGDIMYEGQIYLAMGAERILRDQPERVDRLLSWLREKGMKTEYDPADAPEKRLPDDEPLRRQLALYLAARDRLESDELARENIAGVSIRCQHELSVFWGTDACTLPAFLPFGEDSEGKRPVVPTSCEGDIKGLLTMVLLHNIDPQTPPLFGDLKFATENLILISNCGASSVWWAARSDDPAQVLPKVTAGPQCQGESGAAFCYDAAPGQATIARLIRRGGEYIMQLALAEVVPIDQQLQEALLWGEWWPRVPFRLSVPAAELVRRVGSNHLCATVGDRIAEIEAACREFDIEVERLDE